MLVTVSQRAFTGWPYPLGATWDGSGVNFSLFSEHADGVELCIFEQPYGQLESTRVPLKNQTDFVWHAYLPDARPGLLYGYRVFGPHDPRRGLRFNPHKLLIDPYAKAITGPIEWSDAMFGYPLYGSDDRDLLLESTDSAPGMPKAVVIEPAFSWGDDRPPRTPWHESIIYEAHVKGFTAMHPDLSPASRGTYAGLADYRVIEYLQRLGITAIELMPVHHFVHDKHLLDGDLRNYWGYNSIGFFAPDPRYARAQSPGARVNEFKTMVKTLHNAQIEVILDVVYNHTAEGNHYGPTLSFRGIDNLAYYRVMPGSARHYMDYTGTGNTLNMQHPRTIQLIMDSLRYWVLDMHVDGFRFDLASALARELHEVDRLGAFFDIIHQDPVLSQVKLIAEPWDLGEGGYQVGNFPVLWAEWNGRYRDNIRRFWRGDYGQTPDLGYRLTGSSDLYALNGRRPYASVNFITAHDGFTLRDLVSYNDKHNDANGEHNRDGTDDNLSWNCGHEGATENRDIRQLRARQTRNFLATLFLSLGVPMLLHGDESGRTQLGNNNAYCQDNEVSWQSWALDDAQRAVLDWTRRMIAVRKSHPNLRRREFFRGRPAEDAGPKDLQWLRSDGTEMGDADWTAPATRSLGMYIAGRSDAADEHGEPRPDDSLLVLLNAAATEVDFRLPIAPTGSAFRLILDTSTAECPQISVVYGAATYKLPARTLVLLAHSAPAT